VKLIGAKQHELTFHLGTKEAQLLQQLAELYSRLPARPRSLSKSTRLPEHEILLQEALTEQRAECLRRLRDLLADKQRLRPDQTGAVLALSHEEIEWLLQVLNDIRVGSWVTLGSPENPLEKLSSKTAPHLWAMEMAGYFEMHLLDAITGE
jgi:hypothetical protein